MAKRTANLGGQPVPRITSGTSSIAPIPQCENQPMTKPVRPGYRHPIKILSVTWAAEPKVLTVPQQRQQLHVIRALLSGSMPSPGFVTKREGECNL